MSEMAFISDLVGENLLPKKTKEAIENKKRCWTNNSLRENIVCQLVENNGVKIVSSRLKFGVNDGPTEEIKRYKARLMIKGYSQVLGNDCHGTYS